MKLLKFENYRVTIEPEMLSIKVFNKLWTRDKSKDKSKAIQEFSYIYFMVDPRSDYLYIIDPDNRSEAIKKGEGLPELWLPDKVLQEAMEYYASFKPASALLLEDTRVAVDKLRKLLREIDLSETDDKGKPVYTLNTITATIKLIPSLVRDLDEAEKAIAKEIYQSNKVRGAQEKSIYEDM